MGASNELETHFKTCPLKTKHLELCDKCNYMQELDQGQGQGYFIRHILNYTEYNQ